MARELKVRIYSSFEEENEAEARRRAEMTPAERMKEFAAIQERVWGKDWHSKPMVKVATWEEPPDCPRDLADAEELRKLRRQP